MFSHFWLEVAYFGPSLELHVVSMGYILKVNILTAKHTSSGPNTPILGDTVSTGNSGATRSRDEETRKAMTHTVANTLFAETTHNV